MGLSGVGVRVRLASGEAVTLDLGHVIEGADPPQRYIYRAEDDAIYAARDGLLEAYRKPLDSYRNRLMVSKNEWEVVSMNASLEGESVAVERTATRPWCVAFRSKTPHLCGSTQNDKPEASTLLRRATLSTVFYLGWVGADLF